MLHDPDLFPASVRYGFGTRHDTYSQIPILRVKQIHSTEVVHVEQLPFDAHTEADGLVTRLRNTAVGVVTADCVPMLFADPHNSVVGASHQGWKGLYNNMPGRMIRECQALGSDVQSLRVAIGPSIGPCCYRIYGERYDMFRERYARFARSIFFKSGEETYLHLARLAMLQLGEAGVTEDHISLRISCTRCDAGRYFSYQREGRGCGHMVSYIMMV